MKVMVMGANGQLGTDLCRALQGYNIVPLTHADIEITDINSIEEAINRHKPEVVINTAAFVRVDDCESEHDKAFLVNAIGARNIAVVSQKIGAKLAHISTDYVFGGENHPNLIPYTEFDNPVPLNIYGKSKIAGEDIVRQLCWRHFIIRTSALFGVVGSSGKGGNFVESILKLAREGTELRVVNDQTFSPTYTKDLADKIAQLITTEYYGTFHITNKGSCSWYEFATEILKLASIDVHITQVASDEHPRKAGRPKFSVLDNYHLRLLGMGDIRPWQEALKDYMEERGHDSHKNE